MGVLKSLFPLARGAGYAHMVAPRGGVRVSCAAPCPRGRRRRRFAGWLRVGVVAGATLTWSRPLLRGGVARPERLPELPAQHREITANQTAGAATRLKSPSVPATHRLGLPLPGERLKDCEASTLPSDARQAEDGHPGALSEALRRGRSTQ